MKTLVCMIGQLRAADVTWPSFKKHVLDNLGADLAVASEGDEYGDANPFWRHAGLRVRTPLPSDLGAVFDSVQKNLDPPAAMPGDWRRILAVPGNWLGGLGPSSAHPGAGAILTYKKWAFLQQLITTGKVDCYDRFVVTRSDFLWLAPHPPLDLLALSRIWIPAGEDHGGVNDRHAVVSRRLLQPYLDGLTPLLTWPENALRAGLRRGDWNIERFFEWQLRRAGVLKDVRRMPYLMTLVRSETDPAGWSGGEWDAQRGVYIKTPAELVAAERNAAYFVSPAAWRRHLGGLPSDDHVLRRATLVRCSRLRALAARWWPRALPCTQSTTGHGIVVGIGGDALYFLRSQCAARLTPCQKRKPWHLAAPTRLETKLVGATRVYYVRCGHGFLKAPLARPWRFRRALATQPVTPAHRFFNFFVRIIRMSYFCLCLSDAPACDSAP